MHFLVIVFMYELFKKRSAWSLSTSTNKKRFFSACTTATTSLGIVGYKPGTPEYHSPTIVMCYLLIVEMVRMGLPNFCFFVFLRTVLVYLVFSIQSTF